MKKKKPPFVPEPAGQVHSWQSKAGRIDVGWSERVDLRVETKHH